MMKKRRSSSASLTDVLGAMGTALLRWRIRVCCRLMRGNPKDSGHEVL